jgi:hypothetical protein
MRAHMRTKSAAKVQKKIDTRKEMSIFFVLNSYNGGFATIFCYKGGVATLTSQTLITI